MKRFVAVLALTTLAGFGGFLAAPTAAEAAGRNIAGPWIATFFLDPDGSERKDCITFTRTHGVLGMFNSGTWTSPSTPGWGGEYVVEKSHVRFVGTFGNIQTAEMGTVNLSVDDIKGIGFDHFFSGGTHSSGGTFRMTRAACILSKVGGAKSADPVK